MNLSAWENIMVSCTERSDECQRSRPTLNYCKNDKIKWRKVKTCVHLLRSNLYRCRTNKCASCRGKKKKRSAQCSALNGQLLFFKGNIFSRKNIRPSHILWFLTNKPVSFVITGKALPHSKYLNCSCIKSSVSLGIVSLKRYFYSSGFIMKTHVTWFRIIE